MPSDLCRLTMDDLAGWAISFGLLPYAYVPIVRIRLAKRDFFRAARLR